MREKKTVAIGIQNFEDLIVNQYFYIDKTKFLKEWWENGDAVTLIARPRRFGKTLTMDMVEKFFSVQYAGRGDLFEKLFIWQEEKYQKLQGQYPVISLSFAEIKEASFLEAKKQICILLSDLYRRNRFLLNQGDLMEIEKEEYLEFCRKIPEEYAITAIRRMAEYLYRFYGKRVVILLDEYDTPMQEAYLNGYWEELATFIRGLFHATFKTNLYLERAIMTGITRIGKESIFSDLNNLTIITTTSEQYQDSFGFTEQEVFTALEEYGLSCKRQEVKSWYDGFTFGTQTDVYNPWSIINYLKLGKIKNYWANTSSNSLAGKLIQESSYTIKEQFEWLLQGKFIQARIEEQIVFNQLGEDEDAIWSLLLASGYLKVVRHNWTNENEIYKLALTNKEIKKMFEAMVAGWFRKPTAGAYNGFLRALLEGKVEEMNLYMNQVALKTFSSFDIGNKPSKEVEPERFYHGFVLGLMVELENRYILTSNRESGFGRYDVMLEPKDKKDIAYIFEFKVHNPKKEVSLEDTVMVAKKQIEEKQYEAVLVTKGIPPEHIKKYGFAFMGKTVLIG